MQFKCAYCKNKNRYKLTKVAYDDMEYIGVHSVKCKYCSKTFGLKFNGVYIRSVK